jgi:glycosyltransferase involved in cell wall biosynthesis
MYVFIKGIAEAGHQVKVLAFNTNKSYIDPESIPGDFRQNTGIELVYKDLSINPLAAFANLFSRRSFHVERFISQEFISKLENILKNEEFDIIQIEFLYMAPYLKVIRRLSAARVILHSHNIEHMLWERIAAITKNPLKKLYIGSLAKKLKNFELQIIREFDGVCTFTGIDAGYFIRTGCKTPVIDIPFGIDLEKYHPQYGKAEFPSLFHIGSMNWIPNLEGIKWFLDHAWPLIHNKFPGLKFYLAGRLMPEWLLNLKMPNVVVLGEVADATGFINSKSVMVVPLFSGSGIRVKIIEAMALGKAVISTAIGAEGIEYTAGENILIANNPDEFIRAVESCIQDIDRTEQIGRNARKLIEDKHSLAMLIRKLEAFYKSLIEN